MLAGILAGLLLALQPALHAAPDGSVGSAYLLRGVSPQEDALGGGALAAYGNAAAQWENPAALVGTGALNLAVSEAIAPLGGNTEYVALGVGLGPGLRQHLGIQAYLESNSDTFRDAQGEVGASFSDSNALFGMSYAASLGSWGLGVGLKAMSESLANQSALPGAMGDLGLTYAPNGIFMVSGALRNLGSVPHWSALNPAQPESLEFSARENLIRGDAPPHLYQFLGVGLAGSGGTSPGTVYGFGVDYPLSYRLPLVLRAAYNNGDANTAFPYGLSAGFGFTWSNLECDYSFSSLGELGAGNRLGLSWTPSGAGRTDDTEDVDPAAPAEPAKQLNPSQVKPEGNASGSGAASAQAVSAAAETMPSPAPSPTNLPQNPAPNSDDDSVFDKPVATSTTVPSPSTPVPSPSMAPLSAAAQAR